MKAISEHFADKGNRVTVWTTDALDVEYLWRPGSRRVSCETETVNGVIVQRHRVRHFPFHRYVRRVVSGLNLGDARFWFSPASPFVPSLVRKAGLVKSEFDLVHVTALPYDVLLLAGKRAAAKMQVPLVITPFTHMGDSLGGPVVRHYSRPHQLEVLREADLVFVQTRKERDFLRDRGVSPENLRVVGVGVTPSDLEGGMGERFRRKHGIQGPIVAFLGVRCRDKGTLDLIHACERLWASGEEVHPVLLGGTTSEFDSEWRGLDASTRRRCLVLSDASEEEKRDLLDAMDILTLPSRTDSFGIVLLEAWFYGKPVIAASAGALTEVVRKGEDGELVPYGDPDALASVIHRLLGSPALRERYGEAGRRKVLSRFTWESRLKEIESAYSGLLGVRHGSSR